MGYDPTIRGTGCIAQEVETVIPEWVSVNGDGSGYKNIPGSGYLKYALVKSIQDINSIIELSSAPISSPSIVIADDGTVSVGTLKIDTTTLAAGNNNALCHLGSGGAGEILGDCHGTPADSAEYSETDGPGLPGSSVAVFQFYKYGSRETPLKVHSAGHSTGNLHEL